MPTIKQGTSSWPLLQGCSRQCYPLCVRRTPGFWTNAVALVPSWQERDMSASFSLLRCRSGVTDPPAQPAAVSRCRLAQAVAAVRATYSEKSSLPKREPVVDLVRGWRRTLDVDSQRAVIVVLRVLFLVPTNIASGRLAKRSDARCTASTTRNLYWRQLPLRKRHARSAVRHEPLSEASASA